VNGASAPRVFFALPCLSTRQPQPSHACVISITFLSPTKAQDYRCSLWMSCHRLTMVNFRRKQLLGVFLRRTRVTAGLLLLVFACGASAKLQQEGALAVPDGMSVLDYRYAKLRPLVPKGQVVCFRAVPGIPREKADAQLYSAQYFLAPTLLTPGSDCESFIELTFRGACVGTRSGETCETF
jgi:hypothetical protein